MNSPEQWNKIQEIFHVALKSEDRAEYLTNACHGDPELQSEVEALLVAHEQNNSFLNTPAWATTSLAESIDETQIIPTKSFSHYQIISLLGKGGMGEVYLASDSKLGRKAALKILPERLTSEVDLVRRFEREARAASALNHPNILTVYEIGEAGNSHFIATEFIEGLTLRQRLETDKIPLKEILEICIQVSAALTAAHEAGIIHRDIKPENIMLRPDGYVKVLDFGLAKLTEASTTDDSTTQTGLIMGTPSYMSPEQARGQKVDYRTDIWSLGIILHEMISGTRPFTGQTRADLLVSILEREPSLLPEHFPIELRKIVAKSLEKDQTRRYATAREFAQELKELRLRLDTLPESAALAPQPEATLIQQPTEKLPSPQPTQHEAAIITATPKFPVRTVVAGIVLAGILGVGGWYLFGRQPEAPKAATPSIVTPKNPAHQLTWWLTAQRMQNGKLAGDPVQSAGNDWFPNGTKFKFNLVSPQAGYLYLLNEGLTTGGEKSLNLLFPTPKNNQHSAAITANQPIQTDNYIFDEHEGTEKFWIVWTANPINEIEAAKADAKPAIKNINQSTAILALLNQHAPQSTSVIDESKINSTITTDHEMLVDLVNLKHR